MKRKYELYVADVRNLSMISDGSVDKIITDPPYSREYAAIYGSLSKTAFRVLKNGGSCFIMTGSTYLPEVMSQTCKHLDYYWTMPYIALGGEAVQVWNKHIITFWKPILWFTKGNISNDNWVGDVIRSKRNDKRFHEWGQSESGMSDLISRVTVKNDTILDPFVGGGTTGVITMRLGSRKFIGTDIDASAIETTRNRIEMELKRPIYKHVPLLGLKTKTSCIL
jgi:DNA modification methylase